MPELMHSREFRIWHDHLLQGRLMLQFDPHTGMAQFYPRPENLHTHGQALEWREAGGNASLMACTVVRVGPNLARKPPYLFGLVRLDEGPRLLAIIEGDPGQVPSPGTPLRAIVDPEGTPALTFRLASI